ncbi:MAG: hypothetical protein LBE72_06235 [Rickettsia sp.]|jgi:hypothetical protein|nr:hypothetical protein [Rickettsia sp.]
MTKEEQIKTVALKVKGVLGSTAGMPMYVNFWDDLDMLLNLILEEEKGE